MTLSAEAFAQRREVPLPLGDLWDANKALAAACEHNDALRHGVRTGKGRTFAWSKVWHEELLPLMLYARHLQLSPDSEVILSASGARGVDGWIRSERGQQAYEITVTYPAWHLHATPDGPTSPGAQNAYRMQKLNDDGWVDGTAALRRNRRTRSIEIDGQDDMYEESELVAAWARGLNFVLAKKQRPNGYGRGAHLLVYGEGLSGDFHDDKAEKFKAVLNAIDRGLLRNGFERTILMGWHTGWISETERPI